MFPLGCTSSHQRNLAAPAPGRSCWAPGVVTALTCWVTAEGCSALEYLLPLWGRWAPAEEGTDGGRETVPCHLPKQGQQASAADMWSAVQLLDPKLRPSDYCCLSPLHSLCPTRDSALLGGPGRLPPSLASVSPPQRPPSLEWPASPSPTFRSSPRGMSRPATMLVPTLVLPETSKSS